MCSDSFASIVALVGRLQKARPHRGRFATLEYGEPGATSKARRAGGRHESSAGQLGVASGGAATGATASSPSTSPSASSLAPGLRLRDFAYSDGAKASASPSAQRTNVTARRTSS